MDQLRIAVIIGSTRPGRKAETVARWAMDQASKRSQASYELIDLADQELPLLDEPIPPSVGQYRNDHTRRWAATISRFDGFVLVTPEYNHSTSAALKNAIDYLFAEWNNKSVGFISYGSSGGVRAVEHLRTMAGELMLADVRTAVSLPLATEFEDYRDFTPGEYNIPTLHTMFDQVEGWARALREYREQPEQPVESQETATVDVDTQTALPQTTAWSNAPVDRGVADDTQP